MLTLASALREMFGVQLYKNNARALLSRVLSILNLDWLQHARSVRGVYEFVFICFYLFIFLYIYLFIYLFFLFLSTFICFLSFYYIYSCFVVVVVVGFCCFSFVLFRFVLYFVQGCLVIYVVGLVDHIPSAHTTFIIPPILCYKRLSYWVYPFRLLVMLHRCSKASYQNWVKLFIMTINKSWFWLKKDAFQDTS